MTAFKTFVPLALVVSTVSGCTGLNTYSRFYTPGDSGADTLFYSDANSIAAQGGLSDARIGGVQYVVVTDGETAGAFGGYTTGADVGDRITVGTARYNATYGVAYMNGIYYNDGVLSGLAGEQTGAVTLYANFDDATLRGRDGQFLVRGEIVGGELDGRVIYAGTPAQLDGLIGADGVIGAFHANSSDAVFAGGFVGN